jgi:sigma-B regulation protein RsbU (phosphoserine phosphatase)
VRRIFTKSQVRIVASAIFLLWILKWLFLTPRLRFLFPKISFVVDILDLMLPFAAIYFIWAIVKSIRVRLLWKIRRRLVLANIFIGVIPVLIVIGIFSVSALLVYYQLSYYQISNQIGIHTAQIHTFNLALRERLQELMTGIEPPSSAVLQEVIYTHARDLRVSYPSASIIFRYSDPKTHEVVIYANQNLDSRLVQDYQRPKWLERDFSGLVIEDVQPKLYSGNLLLRSYVASDFRNDLPFSIEISAPCDRYFLDLLKNALGQDMLLARNVSSDGWFVGLQGTAIKKENIIESTFDLDKTQPFDTLLRPMFLYPTSWKNNEEIKSGESLNVELSTSRLIKNLSRSKNEVGRNLLSILKGIVVFFLIVEIVSVVIGIVLTKSITNAVHSLDRGTELVKQGDFGHRIVVRSEDQLGALAESFNQMTEHVQRLLKESVQKERLERELEIAKEVQERLFPAHNPHIGRLDVSGVCLPARIVSGDYYDFLPLGANELGLAIADICGKGISAALLMSSLQATLRSNVLNLWRQDGVNENKSLSKIVEMLNGQIYNFTSDNKFATFFYAVYDDVTQTLTYCNAGHNPPLYFTGKEVIRLRTGGTVVGIFPDSKYEQETIILKPGDLLVAYTDGITESMNENGEEFGEDRLIQLIQKYSNLDSDKMKGVIVEEVLAWSLAEERQDDMTVIVAKMSELVTNG